MSWPEEVYPSKTRYTLFEALRKIPFGYVLLLLLGGYLLITLFFSFLYYYFAELKDTSKYFDTLYFSFITSTTIGFGDIHPQNCCGKTIAIFHGLFSTLYFALMVAFLGVKILFPNHTLHFSKNIIFNGTHFIFRILNSHRGLFINPEVRISVVKHCAGNVIAENLSIPKIDNLQWLDNHDFSFSFLDNQNGTNISEEWEKAKNYNGPYKSRFKIRISISGSYGMQQYMQVISYDMQDIVRGINFKPIQYNNEDKKVWRSIRFHKFKNFWQDFNTYEC